MLGFTILFLIIMYGICIFPTYQTLKEEVCDPTADTYTFTSRTTEVHPTSLRFFIQNNKGVLITFGCILWPLFYMYFIGHAFGLNIYEDALIKHNYEDRIASWVV